MPKKVNHQWRLAKRPSGMVNKDDFSWTEEAVPTPKTDEFVVRNLYLSLDPANRGWMNDRRSYVPPVGLGEVMRGLAIGVVEESQHPNYQPGDLVQGTFGWQKYALSNGQGVNKIPTELNLPLSAYFGVLSMIGFTAYFGLLDIGQPQPGETLVVSAAAGAVGSIVGQIGKIKGCRVVGIAGTDEKCQWLTETLGFDAAINYKTEPVRAKLKEHCPDGIDIYFENVGGQILDDVLTRINLNARIPLCGLISTYNATEPVPGPYNFPIILTQRVRLEGFIVFDYAKRYPEAFMQLAQWLAEGKLQYRVDVVAGLENVPPALNRLFTGDKKGKLVVKISDEPGVEF